MLHVFGHFLLTRSSLQSYWLTNLHNSSLFWQFSFSEKNMNHYQTDWYCCKDISNYHGIKILASFTCKMLTYVRMECYCNLQLQNCLSHHGHKTSLQTEELVYYNVLFECVFRLHMLRNIWTNHSNVPNFHLLGHQYLKISIIILFCQRFCENDYLWLDWCCIRNVIVHLTLCCASITRITILIPSIGIFFNVLPKLQLWIQFISIVIGCSKIFRNLGKP